MKFSAQILVVLIAIHCVAYVKCANVLENLKDFFNKQRNNYGVPVRPEASRRRRSLNDDGVILGSPSHPSHLPKAEPILPGHTLLRPTFGMLKSALRYPHKEMENGFGVYGNSENLGVAYGNTNDRILYSGFRRMPGRYFMVDWPSRLDNRVKSHSPRDEVSSVVLDAEEQDSEEIRSIDKVVQHLQSMNTPINKNNLNVYYAKLNDISASSESSESAEVQRQKQIPLSLLYNSLASALANVGFDPNGGLRSDLPDKLDVTFTFSGKDEAEIAKKFPPKLTLHIDDDSDLTSFNNNNNKNKNY